MSANPYQTVPQIQIAGILSLKEGLRIDEQFAQLVPHGLKGSIGLVYGASKHLNEKPLEDDEIRYLKQKTRFSDLVLITYFSTAMEISEAVSSTSVTHIQLHGPIELSEIKQARRQFPDLMLIKSLPIDLAKAHSAALVDVLEEMRIYLDHVDAFITDTKTVVGGELRFGATGQTHPWSISREIVIKSPKPVIVAGGLDPENVRQALIATGAYGVDVHSGIETNTAGVPKALREKDIPRLRLFIGEAIGYFLSSKP